MEEQGEGEQFEVDCGEGEFRLGSWEWGGKGVVGGGQRWSGEMIEEGLRVIWRLWGLCTLR